MKLGFQRIHAGGRNFLGELVDRGPHVGEALLEPRPVQHRRGRRRFVSRRARRDGLSGSSRLRGGWLGGGLRLGGSGPGRRTAFRVSGVPRPELLLGHVGVEIGRKLPQAFVQRGGFLGGRRRLGDGGAHHRRCGHPRAGGRVPRLARGRERFQARFKLAQRRIAELAIAVNFGQIAPQQPFGFPAMLGRLAILGAAFRRSGDGRAGRGRLRRALRTHIGIKRHGSSRKRL